MIINNLKDKIAVIMHVCWVHSNHLEIFCCLSDRKNIFVSFKSGNIIKNLSSFGIQYILQFFRFHNVSITHENLKMTLLGLKFYFTLAEYDHIGYLCDSFWICWCGHFARMVPICRYLIFAFVIFENLIDHEIDDGVSTFKTEVKSSHCPGYWLSVLCG